MQVKRETFEIWISQKGKFQHKQDSICRPPSNSPDKQNSLEGEISKKISPYINPIYRPPPKPPNIQNTKGERVCVLKNESLLYNRIQNPLTYPNCQGYY